MKVVQNVSYHDVATILKDNKIVAIFQGRDEGGPRALGNRSLLFSPVLYEMGRLVNAQKSREWYRPVAGTVLLENFDEWFDTSSLTETPFMTYAVDVKKSKAKMIPAIIHKNKTCRIQTVTEDINSHYYNLISAFKDLTGIPIIGNTSFNLGGKPIVHTLKDALDTIQESEFEYLYLPEKKVLIYAKNSEK